VTRLSVVAKVEPGQDKEGRRTVMLLGEK